MSFTCNCSFLGKHTLCYQQDSTNSSFIFYNDKLHNTSSHTKTLYLSGDYFCSQMPTEKLAEWGKGIKNFIPNDELWYNYDTNTEYLQHNCLSFQVRRATIFPNCTRSSTMGCRELLMSIHNYFIYSS